MKYLRTSFLILLNVGTITLCNAQTADNTDYVRPQTANYYPSGANLIYVGFGLDGYYPYSPSLYVETPNLTISYEHTVLKHLGQGSLNLGALLSYKGISSSTLDETTNYTYNQIWNYYILGAKCSYHLHLPAALNIEPYTGIMGAYYITEFDFKSTDPNSNEPSSRGYDLGRNNYPNYFSFSVFVGARSYLSTKASVWIELGYGYTSLAFGVCYKI